MPAQLHVANVGDSRVVLIGDSADHPKRLSVDHLPSNGDEFRRVTDTGARIVNGRVGGSLAITRALGDHSLKGPGGGVSPEPHCVTHELRAEDRFVLLASDGLWDVMSDKQAQQLVLEHSAATAAEIAQRLVQAALMQGTRDNVSALVMRLSPQ